MKSKIPHNQIFFGDEEVEAITKVVKSGQWAGNPCIEAMENSFTKVAGTKFAISVGTGTGALRIALLALGVREGDKVAVPGYSCVALANAVLACGADPIPIDIRSDTLNMCPDALFRTHKNSNFKIKAAIVVNTFGYPADFNTLSRVKIPLIEDCSHAFGRKGFGNSGNISIMSLYATKLIGAGEGGVIFSNDQKIIKKIIEYKNYTDLPANRYRLNDKPNSFAAAIANCQLERLSTTLLLRDRLSYGYTSELNDLQKRGLIELPKQKRGRIWYRYTIRVNQDIDELIRKIESLGVVTAKPVEQWHQSPGTNSESAYKNILSLPLYPSMTDIMQKHVIQTLYQVIQ